MLSLKNGSNINATFRKWKDLWIIFRIVYSSKYVISVEKTVAAEGRIDGIKDIAVYFTCRLCLSVIE